MGYSLWRDAPAQVDGYGSDWRLSSFKGAFDGNLWNMYGFSPQQQGSQHDNQTKLTGGLVVCVSSTIEVRWWSPITFFSLRRITCLRLKQPPHKRTMASKHVPSHLYMSYPRNIPKDSGEMEVSSSSWGYPNSWMVYDRKSHWNGWFGGTPISGNLYMSKSFKIHMSKPVSKPSSPRRSIQGLPALSQTQTLLLDFCETKLERDADSFGGTSSQTWWNEWFLSYFHFEKHINTQILRFLGR